MDELEVDSCSHLWGFEITRMGDLERRVGWCIDLRSTKVIEKQTGILVCDLLEDEEEPWEIWEGVEFLV